MVNRTVTIAQAAGELVAVNLRYDDANQTAEGFLVNRVIGVNDTLTLPEGDPWRGASARFTVTPLDVDGEPIGNREFSRLIQPGQAGVNVPAALNLRYAPTRGGGFNRRLSTRFEFPSVE